MVFAPNDKARATIPTDIVVNEMPLACARGALIHIFVRLYGLKPVQVIKWRMAWIVHKNL